MSQGGETGARWENAYGIINILRESIHEIRTGCCKKNRGQKRERLEIKKAVAEMGNSLQGLEDRIAQISEKVEQKGRHGVGGGDKR